MNTKFSKIILLTIIYISVFCFNACGTKADPENIPAEPVQTPVSVSVPAEPAQTLVSVSAPEEPEPTVFETPAPEPQTVNTPLKVYLCPGMPQPYIEVLKQYEQFINANVQDINDDSVIEKFGNEWEYLYNELCMFMSPCGTNIYYALTDLTGDGYPEMILAYEIAHENYLEVIYNYSETYGIGMECATSYYQMTIYQNCIVEYISGGVNYSTTYLQYQDDLETWVVADRISIYNEWDSVNKKMTGIKYYGGNWTSGGVLDTEITEEEYLQIQEKYVTEPMEFEWIPLVCEPDLG